MLATEMTLREEKFARLMQTYAQRADVVPLPCPGLMDFVERGELDGDALEFHLASLLAPYPAPAAAVLGCTHYPFLRPALRKLLPKGTEILDGSAGTARETRRRLAAEGLLREEGEGSLLLTNSSRDSAWEPIARLLLSLPEEDA